MIHPYATHGIRYEASGVQYLLRSDTVDLGDYRGQRVTVYGVLSSVASLVVSIRGFAH